MNSPELLSDLLNRQRAQWLFAAGLVIILVSWIANGLWPSLPAPEIFDYAPILITMLLTLGVWFYPRRGLTVRRQKAMFRMRTESLLMLLLSPFWIWLDTRPHSHHIQISTVLCLLMGALLITEYARFMADGARSGARSRLLANYIGYSSFVLILLPMTALTLFTLVSPHDPLHTMMQKLADLPAPLMWQLLIWHPVVLLVTLQVLWQPERDVDLVMPRSKGDDE